MNPSTHLRRPRRSIARTAAVVGGASLLVGAAGAAWLENGASADPARTDVAASCSIAGGSTDVTVPMTVDDAVDPIAPGARETLTIQQGLPSLPVEVTIDKVTVTTPIPAQIASTDAVHFTGGNLAGSYAVEGSNLVLTYTGPQSSSKAQFPTVTVEQTVASGASGTIEWKVWSRMVADTSFGSATCTPKQPGAVLNTTTITGGSPGTTPGASGPGGSSTSGSTPTTAPADAGQGATSTTTPAVTGGSGPAPAPAPAPQVEACVEVAATGVPPLPVSCPITLPPSAGGLPVPAGGLPSGGVPGLPSGGLPSGGVPGLPSGGLPSGGLPSGGLPSGGLPSGGVPGLPSGAGGVPAPGAASAGVSASAQASVG